MQERHPNLQEQSCLNSFKLEVASWLDCFKPGCLKRTSVGIVLMFFQQFVGINALIYYAPSLFKELGLSYHLQLIMSGVLNIAQFVGVVSSLWTIDRFGRRKLLLLGSLAIFSANLVIFTQVHQFSPNWASHQSGTWLSVSCLIFYMVSFGASRGPVPWAIPAEICV